MGALNSSLRGRLEQTVLAARREAEKGARRTLESLAVEQAKPHDTMSKDDRELRLRLRAHGRQLGDERDTEKDTQEIERLAHECAYEHWHRMLFARFLAENQLLLEPEEKVPVTLDECNELARESGKDPWALAAAFAQRMLPEIFRSDDPVLAIEMPRETRQTLERLLTDLPRDVFLADDALGWTYQFWQSERKDEVNRSGKKIGADELPAVTQLFTEDYMVDFLLDNTLGAWWAGKVLAANPNLSARAMTEEELRKGVALNRVPWKYLRFLRGKAGSWGPAAGTFQEWPKTAKELKCLDPCMGSGHFLVAMFERLVALRVADEKLDEAAAVAAVIRDNLFGLEIDPRCTQIGVFNLALAAWRRAGHCTLPAMNLACSGLAPNTREADWLAIAGDNQRLQRGMERIYRLFQKAAALGSLINPRASEGDLLVAAFHEIQPLLEKALAQESKDDTAHEMALTARGLAKAAEILACQFTLVATNVPYLGRGKQDDALYTYCEIAHQDAKADLATCFLERCLELCSAGGTSACVTPQNWLFQATYHKLREKLLKGTSWQFVVTLGPNAFQDMNWWAATTALFVASNRLPSNADCLRGLDVSSDKHQDAKARMLCGLSARSGIHSVPAIKSANQIAQLDNARCVLSFEGTGKGQLLGKYATCVEGLSTGDGDRFIRTFWQLPSLHSRWEPFIQNVDEHEFYAGRTDIILWEEGNGLLRTFPSAHNFPSSLMNGFRVLGSRGLRIRQMNHPKATIYLGEIFGKSGGTLVLKEPELLTALWCYATSPTFAEEVNKVNPALYKPVGTFLQVPFDVEHWQKVAAEKYPNGLPKPFPSDPTQWLFNGHPAGADQPLHVAVARLLGYQWPRQTGSSFLDCPALGPDGLEKLADADGIVCIPSVVGEDPAAVRLRKLLAAAYGTAWKAGTELELIRATGSEVVNLEEWLRNDFFSDHCEVFYQRPFVWHIWDGRKKDGFHALVNYHSLARPNGEGRRVLDKLTHTYLSDWIERQKRDQHTGKDGAEGRLAAALALRKELESILEGEPPYDLFVRWKPLPEQPVGWDPDINDGVRINIRPFMLAKDVGRKGAGILRDKPNIKWNKDRGEEPKSLRPKESFPWFWGCDPEKSTSHATDFMGGREYTGDRWNDLHYTNGVKRAARGETRRRSKP